MRAVVARIHRGLAWALLGGLLLQVYFSGVALFGAGSPYIHENWGYMLWLITPLLLVLALVGGLGWRTIGLSALVVVMVTVQVFLPHFRADLPWVSALHPLNALAIVGLTTAIALTGRSKAPDDSRAPSQYSRKVESSHVREHETTPLE